MLYPISRLLSTLEPVENTWLTGTILAAVAFGVEITLCGLCLVALTKTPDFNISRRRCYWKPSQPVAFMGFVCLAVFLGTLHIVAQARVAQLAFVVNRNVAEIYELLTAITPVGNIASAVFVLINWLTDSLLIWRCILVYKTSSRMVLCAAASVPCLLMLSSLVLGTLWLFQMSASPWSPQKTDISIAFIGVTLVINAYAPLLIILRIALYRRIDRQIFGERPTWHSSVISMLVETASLVLVFAIFFLVSLIARHPIVLVPLQVMPQIQLIASLSIIYRVSQNRVHIRNDIENRQAIPFNSTIVYTRRPMVSQNDVATVIDKDFESTNPPKLREDVLINQQLQS